MPRTQAKHIIDRVKNLVGAMVVDNPRDPATVIGPLVNKAQFDRVQHYIRRGLAQGATLIVGGEGRPIGLDTGYFVRPTVFADVNNDMDMAQEEIFSPVPSIIPYDSQEQAIEIANASPYGLQAGSVLINRVTPELLAPFGGVSSPASDGSSGFTGT